MNPSQYFPITDNRSFFKAMAGYFGADKSERSITRLQLLSEKMAGKTYQYNRLFSEIIEHDYMGMPAWAEIKHIVKANMVIETGFLQSPSASGKVTYRCSLCKGKGRHMETYEINGVKYEGVREFKNAAGETVWCHGCDGTGVSKDAKMNEEVTLAGKEEVEESMAALRLLFFGPKGVKKHANTKPRAKAQKDAVGNQESGD